MSLYRSKEPVTVWVVHRKECQRVGRWPCVRVCWCVRPSGEEGQFVSVVWGDAGLSGGMMQSELGSGSLS